MNLNILCAPSLLYAVFTIIQIILDFVQTNYNEALLKTFVCIPITILLNVLCIKGYETVAWAFVMIPLIFMMIVVFFLMYIFGMKVSGGDIDYTCSKYPNNVSVDNDKNIVINDPDYDYVNRPAYYEYPNIIVPNPNDNEDTMTSEAKIPPYGSSDPYYTS